jgi:mannosyltransferase OCH1-like enzyme
MFIVNKKAEQQAKFNKLKSYYENLLEEKRKENIENIKQLHLSKEFITLPANQYKSVIPLNIFTCWHTLNLPPKMQENFELLKEMNPEFNVQIYDNNMCLEFIKQYFDNDVVNAYQMLKPESYKSDLWRFCVLYIFGGIYLDIKFKCFNGFRFIALTEKEHFAADRLKNYLYTAVIVTLPKNPIMLKCIEQIVKNVKTKFYGVDDLFPTGPGLFGDIVLKNTSIYSPNIDMRLPEHGCFVSYNGSAILKVYDEYRAEQNKYKTLEHYSVLWKNNDIYY